MDGRVLTPSQKPDRDAAASKRDAGPRVLLLQGPVGPFFRELQEALSAAGARPFRVLFNAGDVLFAPDRDKVRFRGGIDQWRTWLEERIATEAPDTVVLFGAKRPAHRVARELCDAHGIRVLCLEEGYLRSGYVTCEARGNNDQSPICGRMPEPGEHPKAPAPATVSSSFKIMSWWGFLYFTTRIIFSPRADEPLIHRPLRGPFVEAAFWLRNIFRLATTKWTERQRIARLAREHHQDYFLVPLQMPSDSQMGAAARGWNIERLVDATMRAFVKTGAARKLVFKLHPLDGHARTRERMIRDKARTHGLSDAIVVLHSGSIAELSIHSAGMIVINSTSGMTAIHHGTPLLVMGEAVFRNAQLVQCGETEADIEAFMRAPHVADAKLRQAFEAFVAREALLPGDFYRQPGRDAAAAAIAAKATEAEQGLSASRGKRGARKAS